MTTKVLTIASQKGGSAKTTTAVNVAVAAILAGLKVEIIDIDPQVSACNWKDIRGKEQPPAVTAKPVPHLERALGEARSAGTDLVIVDTAGRTNDATAEAAKHANLILVVLQPSLIDLKTLDATLQIIRLAGNKPTRALLTRVRPVGTRHETTTAWLTEEKGVEVCPTFLGERVIYQETPTRKAWASWKSSRAARLHRRLDKSTCMQADF